MSEKKEQVSTTETSSLTLYQKLAKMQQQLAVPKENFNEFGKFNYRSAEDILNAVKPLLKDYGCALILRDEIESIGGWNYVKAIVTLHSISRVGGPEEISTTAYAREQETKSGMDQSQITGAASSYARKYALNGLFAIDNTKDADAMDNSEIEAPEERPAEQTRTQSTQKATAKQVKYINDLIPRTNTNRKDFLDFYKRDRVEDMTFQEASRGIELLERKLKGNTDE